MAMLKTLREETAEAGGRSRKGQRWTQVQLISSSKQAAQQHVE
jgi:hypothetical protein